MRNRYSPYFVGAQSVKPYSRGANHVFPIGDMGMKTVLTKKQLDSLVKSIRTDTPIEGNKGRSPMNYARTYHSDKKILEYYDNIEKPKVKRTVMNSGTVTRAKKEQPTIPYKLTD